MAVLMSIATGNLTSSTTWGTVDSTSYSNSESASSVLTTAYSGNRSSAFTPGAITIDGIAVKLSVRTGTTGTMSVSLYNNTGAADVAGTEVTINCSDLPAAATADLNGGWIFFKFSSSVLLLAATSYSVQAKTSSSSQISLFVSATTNLSRCLRTTTTAAPAAGDDMIVCGEYTGAGTSNSFVVTMDSTATTDYGSNSTSLVTPAMAICSKGTLRYGTSASTNYVLRLSGNLIIYSDGTYQQGYVGTEMPRTSTAVLEFDCAADNDFGLTARNLSTCTAQGLSRTSGKNIDRCLLNTDEAAAQTVLGVDTDTGWLDTDEVVIATTTQTRTQSEKRTLSGAAGATSITVSSGLTNAHSGTSPTQAEVVLLTRNVKVRSVSSTALSFISFRATATVDWDWVECRYLGGSTTGYAITIFTTTGSCNLNYISIYDAEGGGISLSGSTVNNITLSYIICYNTGTSGSGSTYAFSGAATSNSYTISYFLIVTCYQGFLLADLGSSYSFITVIGSAGNGFIISEGNATLTGTITDINCHANFSGGCGLTAAVYYGTITNLKSWRNSAAGLYFLGGSVVNFTQNVTFDTPLIFGNQTNNINAQTPVLNVIIKNGTIAADTSFATTNGIIFQSSGIYMIFEDCTFGVATGIYTTHTQDVNFSSASSYVQCKMRNTTLASATEVANQASLSYQGDTYVSCERLDQTDDNHKTYYYASTNSYDSTVTVNSVTTTERITPRSASVKAKSGIKQFPVADGGTVTASVWVQKSATYNGAQPRLIVKRNVAMGITSDTVLDTMTVGTTTDEQLTGTTAAVIDDGVLEFYVDCDGILGYINQTDWTFS